MAGYAAVVLAGGAARRLGGRDKPALPVGGRSMLSRVLDAAALAAPRVVVGPPRPGVPPDVVEVREQPPGGGPVAALAAGLAAVAASVPAEPARLIAVLAADLPFVTRSDLAALADAAYGHDGAVLADAGRRPQWLCGVYRASALNRRLGELGDPAGQAVRRLVAGLDLALVARPDTEAPPWYDCDTEDDYRRAGGLA